MRKEQRIRLLMTTVFATCLARLLCHAMNFILSLFQNFCVLLHGTKMINWHSNILYLIRYRSLLSEEVVIALKMAIKILPRFNNSIKLLLPFSKWSRIFSNIWTFCCMRFLGDCLVAFQFSLLWNAFLSLNSSWLFEIALKILQKCLQCPYSVIDNSELWSPKM